MLGEEQQIAFHELKGRLIKPSTLHLLTIKLDFIYTQIIVNLLQAVLYIKFRMTNPS